MAKSRLQPPIAKRTAPRTNPSAPTPVTTAPSRTHPFFPLQKPCPLWGLSHLPPFPPVFFAATSLWLATLCHLLRTHSLERQSQAYSPRDIFFSVMPGRLWALSTWFSFSLSHLFTPPTSCQRTCHFTGQYESSGLQPLMLHSSFMGPWYSSMHAAILLGP